MSGRAFLDQVNLVRAAFFHAQKTVSGFGAEMRHINDSRRIIGQNAQYTALRKRLKAFAGF